MKEFAGIQLSNLNIYDLVVRYKVQKAFVEHYECPSADSVIQYVENCIQANLSLPINVEDALAVSLKYMPEDHYLIVDSKINIMLRMLSLALKRHKLDSYQERLLAIHAIKDIITLNNNWLKTARDICNAISDKNLEIATEHLQKISGIAVRNESKAYMLSLQLSLCMQVMTGIERRENILRAPFYTEYDHLYIDKIMAIYKTAEICAIKSLAQLKNLPEISKQAGATASSHRSLFFLSKRSSRPHQVEPTDNDLRKRLLSGY